MSKGTRYIPKQNTTKLRKADVLQSKGLIIVANNYEDGLREDGISRK
jgi:hypothetical protein